MTAFDRNKTKLEDVVSRIDETTVRLRLDAGGLRSLCAADECETLAVARLVCFGDTVGWGKWLSVAVTAELAYYRQKAADESGTADFHFGHYVTTLALCAQRQHLLREAVQAARLWLPLCRQPHLNWVMNISVLLTAALASRREYALYREAYTAKLGGHGARWRCVVEACDAVLARDQATFDARMPDALALHRHLVRYNDGSTSGAARRTICLWGIAINEAARIAGLKGAGLGPELPLLPPP